MSQERTREELLDDLTAMTRARDLLADIANRNIEQRDHLAGGLRLIRDSTSGYAHNIAARVLSEAEVPEPEDEA